MDKVTLILKNKRSNCISIYLIPNYQIIQSHKYGLDIGKTLEHLSIGKCGTTIQSNVVTIYPSGSDRVFFVDYDVVILTDGGEYFEKCKEQIVQALRIQESVMDSISKTITDNGIKSRN